MVAINEMNKQNELKPMPDFLLVSGYEVARFHVFRLCDDDSTNIRYELVQYQVTMRQALTYLSDFSNSDYRISDLDRSMPVDVALRKFDPDAHL